MESLSLTRIGRLGREWLVPARSMRRRIWPPALGLAYIGAIALLGGLRADHVLIGLLGFLDLYNQKTRLFLRTFLPFIATGLLFDSMRYYYWQGVTGRVHVAEPYLFEHAYFAIGGQTLNEYFLDHHWAIADLATGFAYLTFVGEYLAMAMVLFFVGAPARAATFARCFLVVNAMGFLTYFLYPAAPPWYVSEYGLGPAVPHAIPSAAAAHRFDALLGTHFFDQVYGRGIDVFGAIPSLHVAYPLMGLVLAFRFSEVRWLRIPAVLFAPLMCFAAVYLQHHYILDVVIGLLYAGAAVALVTLWERRHARREA